MDLNVNTTSNSKLVLLAHGSKDPNWCQTFEDGLAVINRSLEQEATLAYMEMASPSLETVIGNEYLRGHRRITVLPLFFAEGRHLLHDVPAQLDALRARFSGLDIELLEAVGRHAMFWETLGKMIAKDITRDTAGILDVG